MDQEHQPQQTESRDMGGSLWLSLFLTALEKRDEDLLLNHLVSLQSAIQRGKLVGMCATDYHELRELLTTGKTMVAVGSGTHGHRIYIDTEKRQIFMPFDQKYSGQYAQHFREFFGLADNDENLTVNW